MKTRRIEAIVLFGLAAMVFSCVSSNTQKEIVEDEQISEVIVQNEQMPLVETVPMHYEEAKKMDLADHKIVVVHEISSPPMAINYNALQEEEYNTTMENSFKYAQDAPLSTFSIDVDAASYSNMRRFINQGQFPPADAIRTEELINYFSYGYEKPAGKDPVKISAEAGECPWNASHRLVRIGIKAKEIASEKLPASNLVFLIDVSGSMQGPTRLELVKSSLKLLINNLREKDRVAIVVYAGSAGEVLPSTSGSNKQKIREALDNLSAGGSTAGGAGIQLAYKIAKKNFIEGGNNRIILCTDGDFNVGVSSVGGLESLIEKERKSSVFLTVLGYGMGNYKDNKMQTLAEKGNGNHAYIDNLQEANKVLVGEFGGTIYTVAKDVKLQIEFNPKHVQAYRLIGYESRLLKDEDFNDDTKDAGEMGAGHNVTAFYEIVPAGVKFNNAGSIDPLKYQKSKISKPVVLTGSEELLTIKLRYKEPDGNSSKKIELPVIDRQGNNVSSDFRFAAAVAMFGQLLGDSQYKGNANYDKVIALAKTGLNNDEQGYRREFVRLVETVKGMGKRE
jgi:Ca-activated chloride channel family protein